MNLKIIITKENPLCYECTLMISDCFAHPVVHPVNNSVKRLLFKYGAEVGVGCLFLSFFFFPFFFFPFRFCLFVQLLHNLASFEIRVVSFWFETPLDRLWLKPFYNACLLLMQVHFEAFYFSDLSVGFACLFVIYYESFAVLLCDHDPSEEM